MQHAEIASIYEGPLFHSGTSRRVEPDDPQWNYLMRFIPPDRDARILDAGCGNGSYSATLAEAGYGNIVAIDLHEHVDTGGAFRYQRSSIDKIDLPDNSVDFLYSFSVVYHLPNPSDGFKEFYRVMKPGTSLVLSAHTRYSPFTMQRVILRALGKMRHLRDVRFRSAADYVKRMKAVGFAILDVDGYRLVRAPRLINRLGRPLCRNRAGRVNKASPPHSAKWVKTVYSIFGYHFLIAARKGDAR